MIDVRATRYTVAPDDVAKNLADLIDVCYEQTNVFSALVGIFGTKALDALSNYEKYRHADTAQQRFPDLGKRGSGSNPSPNESLESKASKRPWAIHRITTIRDGISFGAI